MRFIKYFSDHRHALVIVSSLAISGSAIGWMVNEAKKQGPPPLSWTEELALRHLSSALRQMNYIEPLALGDTRPFVAFSTPGVQVARKAEPPEPASPLLPLGFPGF